MAHETIVPRLYGSEIEYGYTIKDEYNHDTYSPPRLMPPGISSYRQYLQNGGRLYVDLGLIEYATPECSSLDELVTHELAGEQLVWEAYGNDSSEISTLHKRAITPLKNSDYRKKDTSGAHENYSTVVDIARSEIRNALAVHLATRTAYTGAGQPAYKDFVLGQKISGLNNKVLVDPKKEHHSSGGLGLSRLHVTPGDANISPWAIRMKFGTTSLVLRLLEHDKDLSDLFLRHPVEAAKEVAKKISGMDQSFSLLSGGSATALDIQEELAHRALGLSQEITLPRDEQAIIPEWMSVVEELKRYRATGDIQPKMKQFDWYEKKELLELAKKRRGSLTKFEKDRIDLRYDEIPDGFGINKLRKSAFAPYTPDASEIEKAKKTPPETRAKLRGVLVDKIASNSRLSNLINAYGLNVNWGNLSPSSRVYVDFGPVEAKYTDEEVEMKTEKIIFDLKRRYY